MMKPWGILIFPVLLLTCSSVAMAKPAVDGKLVLMWSVPKNISDTDLDFLTRKGVNLVQSWGIDRKWSDKDVRAYLETMQRHHIGVIMTVERFFNGKERKLDWKKAAAFIKKWEAYPAVFAWHPFDEARNHHISATYQVKVYRFIKRLDPNHPVFVSWNGTRAMHYECCFSEKAFDILDLHAYVRDLPGRRQQSLIDEFLSHRHQKYPVIITLRASHVARLPDLPPNGLQAQYNFFFRKNRLTRNIGFYGWRLSPNKGISQVPDLMRQFRELKF